MKLDIVKVLKIFAYDKEGKVILTEVDTKDGEND